MGSGKSKPTTTPAPESTTFTVAPISTSAPYLERTTPREPESHTNLDHLLLAFFTGVLLTLLLAALVFLIIRSCRKCHSSARALDPNSDPHFAKQLASAEEGITYANMTFKTQGGKRASLSTYDSTDADPPVYAQIKVTDSPHLT